MLPTPDWNRLSEISAEANRLRDEGRWDRAAFDRLLAQAVDAVHGHDEFTEFLALYAEPAWLT